MPNGPERGGLASLRERTSFTGVSILMAFLAIQSDSRIAFAQTLTHQPQPHGISVLAGSPEQEKVKAIEAAFSALGIRVLPKLDLYVKDPAMREKIRSTFAVFEANKRQNPGCRVSPDYPAVVPFGQENGFCYRFDPSPVHPATFNGARRIITLPADFNPDDLGSLSNLYHEIVHVVHDDADRRSVPWERYEAFWLPDSAPPQADGAIRVVLEDEMDADAQRIEVLNAAMDGALRDRAVAKKHLPPIPSHNWYARELINRIALEYFGNPSEYQAFVKRVYEKADGGAVFFTTDLMPLR